MVGRAEKLLQLGFGHFKILGLPACLPAFGETKETEKAVNLGVVGGFPCQSFIIVPSVAMVEIPGMKERKIDQRTMEKMGETLDGPIIEDDHHLTMFYYTAGYAAYVGP